MTCKVLAVRDADDDLLAGPGTGARPHIPDPSVQAIVLPLVVVNSTNSPEVCPKDR